MRDGNSRWLVAIALLLFSPCCGAWAGDGSLPKGGPEKPGYWVGRALDAEAAGNPSERAECLQRALQIDPDDAPAHWQSGEIRAGERWQSIDEAVAACSAQSTVDEYRNRRKSLGARCADQVAMAHWCASHQLTPEERLHWLLAFTMQPKNTEAIHKLDLVRYQGNLVPRGQAEALQNRSKKSAAAVSQWKPQLARFVNQIESDDPDRYDAGVRDLTAIRDPLVIPALEHVSDTNAAEVGEVVVATLAAMTDQAAVDSLLRHAVYSPHAQVRKAAATALRSRSLFAYVPTLMAALRSPIHVDFETFTTNGQFGHRLALFEEGPQANWSVVSVGASSVQGYVNMHPRRHLVEYELAFTPDVTLDRDAALSQQALEANKARSELNPRIIETLRMITEQDLPNEPRPWWNWWLDYNEVYQPPVTPTDQVVSNTAVPSYVQYRFSSCFVVGTLVWTSTGPMAIERIQPGDCVLAQDTETGEVAFKPVIATTTRPPSPLVEVRAGAETIRVTRGHPFWISGVGWQMAKELKEGQWLHTTHGPILIDAVAEAPAESCYNLVVMDFSTYFITDQRILVHDNTLRQLTSVTVPGMAHPQAVLFIGHSGQLLGS